MWQSQTYGSLDFSEIPEKLERFYNSHTKYGEPTEITIGTDSQTSGNFTKIVSVVSIICRRHGGIFFHQSKYVKAITGVKEKLETETNLSLEIAQNLITQLEEKHQDLYLACPISIHIDAGNSPQGKTKDLIQALTGWVHAMGYNYAIKPDSYAASSIADRISK